MQPLERVVQMIADGSVGRDDCDEIDLMTGNSI